MCISVGLSGDVELIVVAQIDMDKLAENLQKLGEDDLLQVVQMVHDNKTAETYTKNDVDRMYLYSQNRRYHEY